MECCFKLDLESKIFNNSVLQCYAQTEKCISENSKKVNMDNARWEMQTGSKEYGDNHLSQLALQTDQCD